MFILFLKNRLYFVNLNFKYFTKKGNFLKFKSSFLRKFIFWVEKMPRSLFLRLIIGWFQQLD